jgi:hypothetical protein
MILLWVLLETYLRSELGLADEEVNNQMVLFLVETAKD